MGRSERAAGVESAWAMLDQDLLAELCMGMTDIPSPPGGERALAEWCAERMAAEGLDSDVQIVQGDQANAVGRLPNEGPGPELLLYAPIDTHLSGDPEVDRPWSGLPEHGELTPRARRHGDYVIGLGANNPKGHAAAVVGAAIAIARAGTPLPGVLRVGLGAGGMPVNPADGFGARGQIGHGVGCRHLLEQGGVPDAAVIAKSGDAVAWEEVGLSWFRISVTGSLGYAGLGRSAQQRNPVVASARVIEALEAWFDEYAARNEHGLVKPHGAVSAMRAGSPDRLAFTPAVCQIHLDLRTAPGVDGSSAQRQLERGLAPVREQLRAQGFEVRVERLLSIPGSQTSPDSPIVRNAIAAWELVSGRPHQPIRRTSGATDANILRAWGIPTARLGMARVGEDCGIRDGFARAMNVCSVAGMERLARMLVAIAFAETTEGTEVR